MTGRPLGCLTGSALIAAALAVAAILGLAVLTGNGIFSPGELGAVAKGAPLGGVTSHAALGASCAACHPAPWSSDRMGDRCVACHANVGQQIAAATGLHGRISTTANCRDCHTDHRGPSASLTIEDPARFPHDGFGYSLRAHAPTAARAGVSCRDCHPASLATFEPSTCLTCHQSLDAPYMAEHQLAFGSTCLNCHDGVDAYGARFDHATYPLIGKHSGPGCVACHQAATTLPTLRATSTDCVSCHASRDIHAGRLGASCGDCHTPRGWDGATIDHDRTRLPLTGRHVGVACASCHVSGQWTGIGTTCQACHAKVDPHGGQFPADCGACHATSGWTDVTFSHAQTGFALDGAHATPACAACHPNGRFAGTPATCVGCHAAVDKHNGTFGTDCGACHKPTTWADATFDHAKSAFPLTGAHQGVSCAVCHAGGVFKGTPTTCVSCHAKPASHTTGFGNQCESCHSTTGWTPATFNAPHPFPMSHGGAGGACAACHPSSFSGYSCVVCHTHDPAVVAAQHAGVPGYTVSGCVRCHPNGSGGG